MIVKPVKVEEIPLKRKGYCKKGKVIENVIDRFTKSSESIVEIIDDEGLWGNSNNFRKSFQNYFKNHCITTITVTIRGDRVFLTKRGKK